jgi:Tfp pilus assembly protein PilF
MSFSGLGNCYLKTTDFGRSVDNYKKALAIDPQNKFAYNGLGSAYACAMNKERAV